MVCAKCGQWAYQYDWIHWETNLLLRDGYADPETPSLYWFIVCKPNCELNAVRHASFQFEEVATARSYGDLEVRRAVIKLGRAWTAYYATW